MLLWHELLCVTLRPAVRALAVFKCILIETLLGMIIGVLLHLLSHNLVLLLELLLLLWEIILWHHVALWV